MDYEGFFFLSHYYYYYLGLEIRVGIFICADETAAAAVTEGYLEREKKLYAALFLRPGVYNDKYPVIFLGVPLARGSSTRTPANLYPPPPPLPPPPRPSSSSSSSASYADPLSPADDWCPVRTYMYVPAYSRCVYIQRPPTGHG